MLALSTEPALPERGVPEQGLRTRLAELCARDYRYADGRVFNSICSAPLPVTARVFARYLEANLGDNRVFPSLRFVESEVVRMLGELLGLPSAAGTSVSGATEANLLAVLSAKARFEARGGRGQPLRILLPESAHFSFDKIAAVLDAQLVRVPLDGRLRVDLEQLRQRLDPHTALVVVTAGTSEAGAVDDVPAAAALAIQAGVPLHVDAATGGLLIPAARELGEPLPEFDFALPGVTSIAVDPHKYGGAPIPSGYLLFRDASDLERIRFASHYQGTADHRTLLGTRSGAGVLASFAALCTLGRQGLRKQMAGLLSLRAYLQRRLAEAEFALAFPPQLTVVPVKAADPSELLQRLEAERYLVSVSRRHRFLRLVIHRHHRRRHIDELVHAMARLRSQMEAP